MADAMASASRSRSSFWLGANPASARATTCEAETISASSRARCDARNSSLNRLNPGLISAGFVPSSSATARAFSHGTEPRLVAHWDTRPGVTFTLAARVSCVKPVALSRSLSSTEAARDS